MHSLASFFSFRLSHEGLNMFSRSKRYLPIFCVNYITNILFIVQFVNYRYIRFKNNLAVKAALWASEGKIHFLSERILNRTIVIETTESKKAEAWYDRWLLLKGNKQGAHKKDVQSFTNNDDAIMYVTNFERDIYQNTTNHINITIWITFFTWKPFEWWKEDSTLPY